MKKFTAILLLTAVLATALLTGCGTGSKENKKKSPRIVATIYPAYDWINIVLGDNPSGIEVEMILDGGTDIHSYQPSAEDIFHITTSDLLVFVGGESEKWVKDALETTGTDSTSVLNLLEILGDMAKTEELPEGADHGEHDHDEDEEEEEEYDEHVWLSLRNAEIFLDSILEAVGELDPKNLDYYRKNTEKYTEKLKDLDKRYENAVSGGRKKAVLFGDRFPFRYLMDDYGISYYAAFEGCSAETEASFETISFLSGKMDELGLDVILKIEGSDSRIAETIAKSTASGEKKILSMNSLQSVTAEDIRKGENYLSVMEKNLEVLEEALNTEGKA